MKRPSHQEMRSEVRRVRKRLHLSQRRFAGLFGFPLPTLLHWERGDRRPTGPARVLLQVIAQNPHVVLLTVRRTRFSRPWMVARMRHTLSSRALPGMAVPHYP